MNKETSAKHINVISLKIVKESSILYDVRRLTTPSEAAGLGKRFLEDLDREQVIVCCLDNKNQLVSINVVSTGTLNSSLVHPREVFKTAILSNAASIILFHNHPSGDPEPSQEDINITTSLKDAGNILGIELFDHIIIGSENQFISFKEKNMI